MLIFKTPFYSITETPTKPNSPPSPLCLYLTLSLPISPSSINYAVSLISQHYLTSKETLTNPDILGLLSLISTTFSGAFERNAAHIHKLKFLLYK